ncbi:hypothetical protein INR49_002482 [Caranx melampygus]|nr:hypothetical protein INR49_002482 [Caranx melampygus]
MICPLTADPAGEDGGGEGERGITRNFCFDQRGAVIITTQLGWHEKWLSPDWMRSSFPLLCSRPPGSSHGDTGSSPELCTGSFPRNWITNFAQSRHCSRPVAQLTPV